MRKNRLLLFMLIMAFSLSCKKEGEVISYPTFGSLEVKGTVSAPLIIFIDGKKAGQLVENNNSVTLKAEEGKRKISLLNEQNKILIDTTLTIDKNSKAKLTDFLYTGTGILFPDTDMSNNPAPGKVLMRFVILDKTLPDILNVDITLLDLATFTSTPYKTIKGLSKDKFSGYLQLDDPASPDLVYIVEATDLNGNKVMSVENSSFGLIFYDADPNIGLAFVPNSIISLGIGPPPSDGSSTFYQPQVIFKRIAP